MRIRLAAGTIAGLLLTLALPAGTVAQPDALTNWAEAAMRQIDGPATRPTATTTVHDHFGRKTYAERARAKEGLAAHGRKIPTAGSGSFWVYDPVHHIAAVSEYGDVDGDRIMYSEKPPAPLPQRDLSSVVSAHGLRLGSSAADAVRILHVPPSAVRRFAPHKSILYARADRRCGTIQCAHDTNILFTDGRATGITLADIGP